MKHIVKTVSRYLLLSLTLGCSFFAIKSNTNSWTANYASNEPTAPTVQKKAYTEADFAGEVEADPEELGVSLIQSTTTSTSQYMNFAFKSKTLVGFTTAKNDIIVNIIDMAFTGDINNPVSEDYDRRDEAGLPILEGEVVFITDATSNKGGVYEVYIPETLTRDQKFVVNLSSISSNCITVDGSEYKGDNTWYDGSTLKFESIHIPSTITTVYSGAFTGVPDNVTITYEGNAIPDGFAADWTDAKAENIITNSYGGTKTDRFRNVGKNVTDMVDEHGRPVNFVLGCEQDQKNYIGEQYDRPLVIQFDKVKSDNGVEVSRDTIIEALPLTNTTGSAYDSVGNISDLSYSRALSYTLEEGETIDVDSIVFHNIMKFSTGINIDTSKTYFAKPRVTSEILDLSKLVSFKAGGNSTFAGYSMFSLTMDKNLSLTSDKYPEPHSLYLDVKSDFYQQNLNKIQQGLTEIRYSLYNLYASFYHFVYEGKNGELKDITLKIDSAITYQTLNNDKNNKVSVVLKNSDVAPDFAANKVKKFELLNVTIQMDLLTTSDSGSKSVLAKSQAAYRFGSITVVNLEGNQKLNVFNWNIFLIIFLVVYLAAFTAGAFALYKVKKEKYKNDEFRRVNDKKYLKSSIMYGAGFLVIAYAIIFIIMRAGGFANTIVAFNPTDPLLIAFAIAGLIIGGYFIVLAIKAIKVERERQRAIRLRLNEDVDDDGTK